MAACWSPRPAVTVTAVVLILASACGGESKTPTGGGAPGPTATSQSSPTEQPATPPTKAQLTAALLTAKDLPAGYKISPSGGEDNPDDLTGDASCRKISATDIALGRGTRPGQVAYADVSFSTADDMGGGDESLSSFMTEAAAEKEFSEYVAAADSCRSLGLKVDPTTTIMVTGKPLSLPAVGDESRAYRYLGTVQGQTLWLDAVVFRAGGTLATLTAGRIGGAPESGLLEQIAKKAAGKLK